MENQPLAISLSETPEPSGSTDALIREWLFRFSVEHKEDVAPRLPLWLEAFGGMDAEILERLFSLALKTCKFFPKIAEILEPLASAEKKASPAAAEEAWQRVLDIRRVYWNPDIPGAFSRIFSGLSERVQQAARTAGVFRDFESVEALHVWAKKRFVESFIAYGEREQDEFLLPDGDIKRLLAGAARPKALPASKESFDLHERGLRYAEQIRHAAPPLAINSAVPARGNLWASDEMREIAYRSLGERETNPSTADKIRAQKAALGEKGYSLSK